jgi:hypothetical protein
MKENPMNNSLVFKDSSQPLITAQDALNKLMQIGLGQASEGTRADILAAMENGAKITLEADLFPEAVYRFFLQHPDGQKTNLCVLFMDDHDETVPEPSH